MSGDDQRLAAQKGDFEKVKQFIKERANTCSADEYGLTPLHLAVWNGHTECVRLLVSNSWGVDSNGIKCSANNLVTTMGLSGKAQVIHSTCFCFSSITVLKLMNFVSPALHLAAMDTPRSNAQEITLLLLVVGVDASIQSNKGETAYDIAVVKNNIPVLEAFREFNESQYDRELKTKLQDIVKTLRSSYTYQIKTKTRGVVMVSEIRQHFNVPEFLLEEQERYGNIPEGMTIHEHQIGPLTKIGQFIRLEVITTTIMLD